MRMLKKLWVTLAVVASLHFVSLSFADVVCRKERIEGFYNEYDAAKRVLGDKTTSNLGECEVYITKRGPYLYFQSNLVTDGFDLPTKIATTTIRDLTNITANIYGVPEDNGEFSFLDTSIILRAYPITPAVRRAMIAD